MGAKQTKFEGEYLSKTPIQQPITVQTDLDDMEDILDPRSPHICRTPLNEITHKREEIYQHVASIPAITSEQPSGLLRKRFFKGFSYSLNDPRSPSVFLNRTPLVFDDPADKTLNLDDTFSDLFVETKVPPIVVPRQEELTPNEASPINKQQNIEEKEVEQEEEAIATPKTQPQETIIERDPRSPSIGVDRTPIILNDDNAPDEEDMIETILSTLSLNIRQKLPENKQLERVRNNKKKPTNKTPYRHDMIYEEPENLTPIKAKAFDSPSNKRTPLSCVKNHPNFRSRSVEVSGKSIKTRLPLTSFDDTLHKITPVKKILRYSNMENIENSFEF